MDKARQKPRDTRMLSGNTVQVSVEPYNPEELKRQLNYIVDYTKLQSVVPKGFVTGLGKNGDAALRATNVSGTPAMALLKQTIGDGENDKGEF